MQSSQLVGILEPVERISVTDMVFDKLYSRVLTLELPPGTKLSEADVAKQLNVSRQTIRDAFYRLSLLGFLIIRPQKATVVSHISARDIFEARYVRTAIEIENVRKACATLNDADFDFFDHLLADQQNAIDAGQNQLFHKLDNQFHNEICQRAGLGFTWNIIQEKKAHTDRVRFLSLSFSSQKALDAHMEILAALRCRDADRAADAVRDHLCQIESAVDQLRENNHEWFAVE